MTVLRVVHAGAAPDPLGRAPDALLEAWYTLRDVATAVARAGAEATVVQAAAYDARFQQDGVRYDFVRVPPRAGWRTSVGRWATPVSARWVDRIREARPHVLHVNGLGFPRHVAALSRALPDVPLLLQDHADAPPGRWTRWLHARGLRRAAGISFTTAEQAEPFLRSRLLPRSARRFEIPESSTHFTPGDLARARGEVKLYGDPCLLWLGNLDGNKDPMTVLGAVARVSAELPDVQLWCAFRGPELLTEVRARIAGDARLAERVHLLGAQPRERVETLLRAADFLVQGSHREGTGYAVIEALACGVTPLVTRIPSFRALTGDGAVGGLFAPGDERALAELLLRFARLDRNRLRAAARNHFEAHLSFDVLGRALVDAYRSLIEPSGAGARSVPRRAVSAA